MEQKHQLKLTVRNATLADIPQIVKLSRRIYGADAVNAAMVRGQINHFPAGQFVAVMGEEIIGHCATFRIREEVATTPHNWVEITGNGYASRHDALGDILYGMEVSVSPDVRGKRIGERLYNARKQLCIQLGLKGIIFGGRMPGFARWHKKQRGEAQDYVQKVIARELRDPVINFHLYNDFELIGVLPDYLPGDKDSGGFATLMRWANPEAYDPSQKVPQSYALESRGIDADTVRVATVQYMIRRIDGIDAFEQQVSHFIETAADYDSDFVCFPEMLTWQIISSVKEKMRPEEAVRWLSGYTERFLEFMRDAALRYNINIIGGTHPVLDRHNKLRNVAHVFLRDGTTYAQHKLHITPNEHYWWHIEGGNRTDVIPTDCGPIGVMICYDSEFPEVARHLVNQGALLLFVPFCTDERQGYLRVRYCAQARAVENQCYVITSGMVGNLPGIDNMDLHYAESGIFTPCDFPFARDGIAAMCDTNTETMAIADLGLGELVTARHSGTVQNLKNRRFDLYRHSWHIRG